MRSPRWPVLVLVCVVGTVLASLGSGQEGKVKGKVATLIVQLPKANVKLTINGAATTQKGKTRTFKTPELEPGKKHTYTLVASWRNAETYSRVIRTKEVIVEAGKTIEADLRKEDPKRRDQLIVEYEPTGNHIVEAMCKLGEVGKDDVVYDLGCGDGRIVIAAVKKFGAKKGVGVEIDPELFRAAKARVRKAGVGDKVEIRQGDVLKITDLSEATVVMLYLSKDLNLRLRPVLEKSLKPGARIVSHYHPMGDWKPEKTIKMRAGEKNRDIHSVFLWRIGKSDKK